MTKSPAGTTTSSGQSRQSLKISPGSTPVSFCATTIFEGDGASAGGLADSPRWAFAPVPATAVRTVRQITNNRPDFMLLFPGTKPRAPSGVRCQCKEITLLHLVIIGKARRRRVLRLEEGGGILVYIARQSNIV